jgi:hypothetical protein
MGIQDRATALFILLGFFAGIFFWIEAWYSAKHFAEGKDPSDGPKLGLSNVESLSERPRIRGFLYFLSGGFITTVLGVIAEPIDTLDAWLWYGPTFLASTIVGMVALSAYASFLAYAHLRENSPDASKLLRVGRAFDYAVVLIFDGVEVFREKLKYDHSQILRRECDEKLQQAGVEAEERLQRERRAAATSLNQCKKKVKALKKEQNKLDDLNKRTKELSAALTDFAVSYTNNLAWEVANTSDAERLHSFLKVVEVHLEVYLRTFFERSPNLEHFRGCLYYFAPTKNQLFYLTGTTPIRYPHSRDPLSLDSVAGYAAQHPGPPCAKGDPGVKFQQRSTPSRYDSVISCAIHVPNQNGPSIPLFVLNIDAAENPHQHPPIYLKARTEDFAYLLGAAQVALNIAPADVENWLYIQR